MSMKWFFPYTRAGQTKQKTAGPYMTEADVDAAIAQCAIDYPDDTVGGKYQADETTAFDADPQVVMIVEAGGSDVKVWDDETTEPV